MAVMLPVNLMMAATEIDNKCYAVMMWVLLMKMSNVIMLLFSMTAAKSEDLEGVERDYVKDESKIWLFLMCDCRYNVMRMHRLKREPSWVS